MHRSVDPPHEERQTALADPLERGETASDLAHIGGETAGKHLRLVSGRLARAQEPAIRHDQRARVIGAQVAGEGIAPLAVIERRAIGDVRDQLALLEFGHLLGHLDIARRGGEHFGQLDLPRMQVEPPVRLGQHGAREISDREIVPLAQVIGQRGADIRAG